MRFSDELRGRLDDHLLVICGDHALTKRLKVALPRERVLFSSRLEGLLESRFYPICTILVLEKLDQDVLAVVERRNESDVITPVILVTSSDPENARKLGRLRVHEVVWIANLESELGPAVDRARTVVPLVFAAERLLAAEHFSFVLRKAFRTALGPTPVLTISAWAERCGVSRATLNRHWHDEAPADAGTLDEFLGWVCLVRAVLCYPYLKAWTRCAKGVGVDVSTLRRQARGRMDMRLGELNNHGPEFILRRFEDYVSAVGRGRV